MRIIDLSAGLDFRQIDELLAGSEEEEHEIDTTIAEILHNVKRRGDEALCEYTRKFDGHELTASTIRVSPDEIRERASGADDELVDILKRAARNVRDFHEQQATESW